MFPRGGKVGPASTGIGTTSGGSLNPGCANSSTDGHRTHDASVGGAN